MMAFFLFLVAVCASQNEVGASLSRYSRSPQFPQLQNFPLHIQQFQNKHRQSQNQFSQGGGTGGASSLFDSIVNKINNGHRANAKAKSQPQPPVPQQPLPQQHLAQLQPLPQQPLPQQHMPQQQTAFAAGSSFQQPKRQQFSPQNSAPRIPQFRPPSIAQSDPQFQPQKKSQFQLKIAAQRESQFQPQIDAQSEPQFQPQNFSPGISQFRPQIAGARKSQFGVAGAFSAPKAPQFQIPNANREGTVFHPQEGNEQPRSTIPIQASRSNINLGLALFGDNSGLKNDFQKEIGAYDTSDYLEYQEYADDYYYNEQTPDLKAFEQTGKKIDSEQITFTEVEDRRTLEAQRRESFQEAKELKKNEEDNRLKEIENARRLEKVEENARRKIFEEAQRRKKIEETIKLEKLKEAEQKIVLQKAQMKKAIEEAEIRKSIGEAKKRKEIEKAKRREAIEEAERQKTIKENQRLEAIREAARRAKIEEARRKEALEEAKRREAFDEAKRREAIEEDKRREAFEEAERQKAIEENQRHEAIREAERRKASVEKERRKLKEEKARLEAASRKKAEKKQEISPAVFAAVSSLSKFLDQQQNLTDSYENHMTPSRIWEALRELAQFLSEQRKAKQVNQSLFGIVDNIITLTEESVDMIRQQK